MPGLDEITHGGLPKGRVTLVCGGPGCGKTLFAVEFVARRAAEHGEPGVILTFEETPEELAANVASFGLDLPALVAQRKLVIDHVRVDPQDLTPAGTFDLAGLFIRLEAAIARVNAQRVALDTIESLFSSQLDDTVVRAELRRLFRWLKDRGVTTVVTGERGGSALTRSGLEEYVSDCVIVLDQRVSEEVSTRRIRIAKYRGSSHGGNEFPFVIDDAGFGVVPITASRLDAPAPTERIPSGVPGLDAMLDGKGFYRASAILVSGTAGTGKSTIGASFLSAACARGERCMYFSFEESPPTLVRDMRAVGIDLDRWVKKGLLEFVSNRATTYGLEAHVAHMSRAVARFKPTVAVVDPVSAFGALAPQQSAKNMIVLMTDMLRAAGVTTLLTSLTLGGDPAEATSVGISSAMDCWVVLRDTEVGNARERTMLVLKARGIHHDNRVRTFRITDRGIVVAAPPRRKAAKR